MHGDVRKSGCESAFRRNTAERVYMTEAAHNPEVAGTNPAPLLHKAPKTAPCASVDAAHLGGCARLADISAVGPDRAGGNHDRPDLVEDAVESGEPPVAPTIVAVAWTASAESFDPLRLNVTVPDTPFTVPVKTSTSWKLALPSAWMIRIAVDRRGAAEGAGVGGCGAHIDDQVAAGGCDAVEGRRRIADGSARSVGGAAAAPPRRPSRPGELVGRAALEAA